MFVANGEHATDVENKDFWLFELSALPLSLLLLVVIGKGVLVDVDEFAAKSVVKVVVAVAMDEGWDEEGNWLLISLAVTLLSFIELAPIALAASSSISANNYILSICDLRRKNVHFTTISDQKSMSWIFKVKD